MYVEHGHRLLASLIGMLTIAFCTSLWMTQQPKWLQRLGLIALAAVIFQGVLGGMRVLLNERTLAMIHGCIGPAFFAFTAVLATVTSRRWQSTQIKTETGHAAGLRLLAFALPVVAYVQIVLGALVRHFPIDCRPSLFQGFVLFHVAVGVALTFFILATAVGFVRSTRNIKTCVVPAVLLAVLVLAQVSLGAATWIYKYNYPAFMAESQAASQFTVQAMDWRQAQITTAHVATGSLILAISALLAVNTARHLKVESANLRPSAKIANQDSRPKTPLLLEAIA